MRQSTSFWYKPLNIQTSPFCRLPEIPLWKPVSSSCFRIVSTFGFATSKRRWSHRRRRGAVVVGWPWFHSLCVYVVGIPSEWYRCPINGVRQSFRARRIRPSLRNLWTSPPRRYPWFVEHPEMNSHDQVNLVRFLSRSAMKWEKKSL